MPKITIHLPDQEPLKIGFEDQVEVTIGRADDNDIVAVHDSISSHHAALRLVGSQYVLVDLDSTNGSFYDGAPVTELPLEHGMRVLLGQVEADYEADEAPAAEESAEEGSENDLPFVQSSHSAENGPMCAPFRQILHIRKTLLCLDVREMRSLAPHCRFCHRL